MREWQDGLRKFAGDMTVPQKISFENRRGERLQLYCRQLTETDYAEIRSFEQDIMAGIPDNDTQNIYQPFDGEGLRRALSTGWAVGLYEERAAKTAVIGLTPAESTETTEKPVLAAFLYVIPRPQPDHNVLMDVSEELGLLRVGEDGTAEIAEEAHDVMIADCIMVGQSYRGYGLQRALFYLADCLAWREGISRLCGTASPKNAHSIHNFEAAGYRCVAVKPKYRSERCFFVKETMPMEKETVLQDNGYGKRETTV